MKKLQAQLVVILLVLFSACLRAGSPPGRVISWGYTNSSVSVIPPPQFSATFVTIAGKVLDDVIAISAGQQHNLALKSDGTVVSWGGENQFGETSVPPELRDVLGISAGPGYSLAVRRDGRVIAWGGLGEGNSYAAGLSNIIAVSAGAGHGLALRKDGTIASWGEFYGPPKGLSNIVAVFARFSVVGLDMALRRDGTVIEWNLKGVQDSNTGPQGLSNVVAISGGDLHSLALRSDGTVVDWGPYGNGFGGGASSVDPTQKNVSDCVVKISGLVLSDVVAIAARAQTSMALKRDGTVVVWSKNPTHIPPVPSRVSNAVAIATSGGGFLAVVRGESTPAK
jgi:alpha-tubulin suppressor-like RCC1 family protein